MELIASDREARRPRVDHPLVLGLRDGQGRGLRPRRGVVPQRPCDALPGRRRRADMGVGKPDRRGAVVDVRAPTAERFELCGQSVVLRIDHDQTIERNDAGRPRKRNHDPGDLRIARDVGRVDHPDRNVDRRRESAALVVEWIDHLRIPAEALIRAAGIRRAGIGQAEIARSEIDGITPIIKPRVGPRTKWHIRSRGVRPGVRSRSGVVRARHEQGGEQDLDEDTTLHFASSYTPSGGPAVTESFRPAS